MKHFFFFFLLFYSVAAKAQSFIEKEMANRIKRIKSMYVLSPKERGEWLNSDFQKLGNEIKQFTSDGYVNEGMTATLIYGEIANALHMSNINNLTKKDFGTIAAVNSALRLNIEQVRKGKMKVVNGTFVETK